jgi:hypothetical protein
MNWTPFFLLRMSLFIWDIMTWTPSILGRICKMEFAVKGIVAVTSSYLVDLLFEDISRNSWVCKGILYYLSDCRVWITYNSANCSSLLVRSPIRPVCRKQGVRKEVKCLVAEDRARTHLYCVPCSSIFKLFVPAGNIFLVRDNFFRTRAFCLRFCGIPFAYMMDLMRM